MDIEDKLLEMKRKIANSQKLLDQNEGKKQAILERLKKDYGITEESLPEETEKLREELEKEEKKLESAVDKLYNKYPWEE